jgi:hypothetical protein
MPVHRLVCRIVAAVPSCHDHVNQVKPSAQSAEGPMICSLLNTLIGWPIYEQKIK